MIRLLFAGVVAGLAGNADASETDLTGLVCSTPTALGNLTWEFYDSAALRYFEDGSVSRLTRIGAGAYERYDREGEWAATYYFFDRGEGIHLRVVSRPGLVKRMQNRASPLEKAVTPFSADCGRISDR